MLNYFYLKKRIKKNEGFRKSAYRDSLGHKTIGYGHLIKINEKKFLKRKFNKKYLLKIFEKDFKKAFCDYKKHYEKYNFKKNIKDVLIEMIFQLGIKKQKKFKKMNKHLINKNLYMAALEMQKSLWYLQTPKRVNMLIKLLLKNER